MALPMIRLVRWSSTVASAFIGVHRRLKIPSFSSHQHLTEKLTHRSPRQQQSAPHRRTDSLDLPHPSDPAPTFRQRPQCTRGPRRRPIRQSFSPLECGGIPIACHAPNPCGSRPPYRRPRPNGGTGGAPDAASVLRSTHSASQISTTWHIARWVRRRPRRTASSANRCRQCVMPLGVMPLGVMPLGPMPPEPVALTIGPPWGRGASMLMRRVSSVWGGGCRRLRILPHCWLRRGCHDSRRD